MACKFVSIRLPFDSRLAATHGRLSRFLTVKELSFGLTPVGRNHVFSLSITFYVMFYGFSLLTSHCQQDKGVKSEESSCSELLIFPNGSWVWFNLLSISVIQYKTSPAHHFSRGQVATSSCSEILIFPNGSGVKLTTRNIDAANWTKLSHLLFRNTRISERVWCQIDCGWYWF